MHRHVYHFITAANARGFMMGGGLAYAWSGGYWHHTPLVILNPFAYVAYQLYVGKEQVVQWTKNGFRNSRATDTLLQ